MFGRRDLQEKIVALPIRTAAAPNTASAPTGTSASARKSGQTAPPAEEPYEIKSNEYYEIKLEIFNALIEVVDVVRITKMNPANARIEIRDVVNEIIVAKKVPMSLTERQDLIEDICNDVLGYGPLEPLLARDDIADIMVNGNKNIFIEVKGRVRETNIRFRDHTQLLNVCQRIVSQIGRRVDESSPICDARLPDGSRVNVIVPPLAVDGTALTIRKFKRDKLTLDQLIDYGSISLAGAEILMVIGRIRCNVLVSGGTGSGISTPMSALSLARTQPNCNFSNLTSCA